MKLIKVALFSLVLSVAGMALAPSATYALNPLDSACANDTTGNVVCDNVDDNADTLIGTVVNTLLFVVGTLSVVMIIVGGIYYVISTGDSGKVSKAKNTITYAVVGLVVSFIAYAIVNWVLNLF